MHKKWANKYLKLQKGEKNEKKKYMDTWKDSWKCC